MSTKLLLEFNEEHQVDGISRRLLFNNTNDAKKYLSKSEHILDVRFDESSEYFYFRTTSWSGSGSIHYVEDLS